LVEVTAEVGLPIKLKHMVDDWFQPYGLTHQRALLRGALYTNGDKSSAVIFDHDICNQDRPFEYRHYTAEQNKIVHQHDVTYRFLIDSTSDLAHAKQELEACLNQEFCESPNRVGVDRSQHYPDPTPPEHRFEVGFEEVFGHKWLTALEREACKLRWDGRTCYVDYIVHFEDGWCAVEQNGERYHHPIHIGKERYVDQLTKQNSLFAQGGTVFRWSLDGMRSGESFHEELIRFFGGRLFKNVQKFRGTRDVAFRDFTLYEHQEESLQMLRERRARYGQSASLLVLPTGTGKTHVAVSDFLDVLQQNKSSRMLALAPTRKIRDQLTDALGKALHSGFADVSIGGRQDDQVVVQTNSWACLHYSEFEPEAFDYMLIDEAHHAMAPVMERVVHHFQPKTLLGMTATPERLDQKRLEKVFGEHDSQLTLKEAVQSGILAPIRAYRIKSNLDLSEIRYNGKDYYGTDLQRRVVVPSRDQLVVDTLKKYFQPNQIGFKNGLVFCVSVNHTKQMAKRLNDHGLAAEAVHGNLKEAVTGEIIERYHRGEVQFLTTCSLLGEGWDSPQTSIVVMARPTMSKVVYTQQLGRGTRRYSGKEALYVVDVVDNYSALNAPWSIHALVGVSSYKPFGDVLNPNRSAGEEEIHLDGLYEDERRVEEIDIFTFEAKYPDHLSTEQLARELFVSTDTVKAWCNKGDIEPDVTVPLGRSKLLYFAPAQVVEIREQKGLKEHTEETQYEDFFDFLEEGDYTFSYKMTMMLCILDLVDTQGEVDIEELTECYRKYYIDRLKKGLPADLSKSPYNRMEVLEDKAEMQRSIRANPFEKFERKRFMHEQKDLKKIAFSRALWEKINNEKDLGRIREIMERDREKWFLKVEGQAAENDDD